jgi:hypothetical protein
MSDVTPISARKVRLVVGLLGRAGELTAALADLAASQLAPGRIRLMTPAQATGRASNGWLATGGAQGPGAWIVCQPLDGSFHWSLCLAGPAPADATVLQDARALLELHHWALRRQAEQLDRHLRGGGALLLVEPETDAEERAACTALLKHASGGVQTHEIARLPPNGSTRHPGS